MAQAERIFRIQQMLQDGRIVSKAAFLEELKVSPAQFKRDLEFLRSRFQVVIVYDANKKGYRLTPGEDAVTVALPGPMYTAREIDALLIMEDLLKQLQPGLIDDHITPLRERLKLLLGKRELSSDRIRKRIRIINMASRPSDARRFRTVGDATLSRHRLRLSYYNRSRDDSTERDVSPQRVVYYRGNWYLDSWCHLRNDLRSFAIDAIRKASVLPTPCLEIEGAVWMNTSAVGTESIPVMQIIPRFCDLSRWPRAGWRQSAGMQNSGRRRKLPAI